MRVGCWLLLLTDQVTKSRLLRLQVERLGMSSRGPGNYIERRFDLLNAHTSSISQEIVIGAQGRSRLSGCFAKSQYVGGGLGLAT
jgi:hypothetical protein